MTQENIRVYELAKELGLSNKATIEKLESLSVKVKSHSSSITPEQAKKLKDAVKSPSQEVKKPKAFIVKKVKPPVEVQEPEDKEVATEKQSEEKALGKTDNVDQVEKSEEPAKVEDKQPVKPEMQTVRVIEKPRIGPTIIRPAPSSRPQPPRTPQGQRPPQQGQRPQRPDYKGQRPAGPGARPQAGNDARPARPRPGEKPQGEPKKPIARHIIPQDMYNNQGGARKKPGKKKEQQYKSKEEQQELISLEKTMAQKHKKRSKAEQEDIQITKIFISQPMVVGDLAVKLNKPSAEIVKFLMMQGILATVNQVIDVPTAKKVCESFEIEVLDEDLEAFMEEELEKEEKANLLKNVDEKLLKKRAPVISIMGHVDHGKTTLLDSIRASKHKIVAGEVGGITQSIGAYTVHVGAKKIVFIDTPGHEAFTQMRARGAKATDIAILVVAADDGIMPQTIEAINHAKAAEVPIIVAVNKVDKPDADPDKILQQLTEYGLVPEAWGGDTIAVKVSALQGTGIDELLEYILLMAEVQDMKANPHANASGVVIEANLDKGKGPVATILVQNGTLKTGDCVVCGSVSGKVRALLLDSGERVKKAGPSTPVEILGLTEVPQAGDFFEAVKSDKEMKTIVQSRKEKERNTRLEAMKTAQVKNEIVGEEENKVQQLNLIIKASTNGSAEAVSQSINQLESKEIITKIIHIGVGDISEADVMLASASNAIILGFTVKEDANALLAAEKENVTIKKFNIIYQVLEDIEKTMLSLLQPEIKNVVLGKAEVRQLFTVGKFNKIAGCYVLEGKVVRGKTAKVLRNGEEIFQGQIDQLKRFKDDVKEVATGFECGISFAKFNDLEEGDIIEISTTEEIERQTLA